MKQEFEKEIICPYCDYEFSESYEYIRDDGDHIECANCEKKFWLSVYQTVKYSTHGDCKLNGELPHQLQQINAWVDLKSKEYSCSKCFKEFYDWALAGGKHEQLKADDYLITEVLK